MKPGTLVTLNRNLCRPLRTDREYVLRPPAPLLCARVVAPPDTRPVVPALDADTALGHPPGRRLGQTLRKLTVRVGLLTLIVGVNLALLAFERIERSRERHLFGQAIALREQRAQRLIEANRHVLGVVRAQHAMLEERAAEPATVLARATPARRTPRAGT